MNISVFGMGYVGLVTALSFADLNHSIIAVDNDESKLDLLRAGVVPFHEEGLANLLKKCIKERKIQFISSDEIAISSSEIIIICVGTPSNADGSADVSAILSLTSQIANYVNSDKTVIIKSTVPIGTCEEFKLGLQLALTAANKNWKCHIFSCPEFLREGFALFDTLSPHRIIVGCEVSENAGVIRDLYKHLSGVPFIVMGYRSSELSKYAANSLLAAKISLMNEFARVCEATGADIEDVRAGVTLDPRIGADFTAVGVGYGGSCLPKDVRALISSGIKYGAPLKILSKVAEVNSEQQSFFIEKARSVLGVFRNKRIAIWGLAFKPGVDDIREAPAIIAATTLLGEGAILNLWDPLALQNVKNLYKGTKHLKNENIKYCIDMYDCLDEADALMIFTEWPEFMKPDFEKVKTLMNKPVIIDGRNIYDPKMLSCMQVEYYSVGRKVFQ